MILEYVSCKKEDGIAVITINKPPVNALDSDCMGEIYETLYRLSKETEVGVVIITAVGEKIFVGGADVTEFLAFNEETGAYFTARNNFVRKYLYDFPKPVICAMNGSAFGGGLGLALMSDVRLCPPEAKFSLGEINMGILGLTQIMTRRCLNGSARKYVYTGERFNAEEALRIGMVDEIIPKEQLMDRAMKIAKEILAKPPRAIAEAKKCMNASDAGNLGDETFEFEAIRRLWGTSDKNEAVTAFLEKRAPKYVNK